MKQHGKIKVKLNELLESKGVSQTKLIRIANLQRLQMKRYFDNTVTRLDTDVLARICTALDCSIGDLLEFVPPDERE